MLYHVCWTGCATKPFHATAGLENAGQIAAEERVVVWRHELEWQERWRGATAPGLVRPTRLYLKLLPLVWAALRCCHHCNAGWHDDLLRA